MSADFPGLEYRAHELAADGFITRTQGVDILLREFEGLGMEQALLVTHGHSNECHHHPSKYDEQISARFYRNRAQDRESALRILKDKLGIDEDAESMLALLEAGGLVVVSDCCVPTHGHHTTPHRGCILR
jgi:hypothetical protein